MATKSFSEKTYWAGGSKPTYHSFDPKNSEHKGWHARFMVDGTATNSYIGPIGEEEDALEWVQAHSHQKGQGWVPVESQNIPPGSRVQDPPTGCAIMEKNPKDPTSKLFCLTCNK